MSIAPPADVCHTLQHQLENIKFLEQLIDKKRLDETLHRLEHEADIELDIPQRDGGQ